MQYPILNHQNLQKKTCEINNNINKNNSQYNSYSSLSYKRKKNLNKEEHNENIIKEDIKNENKRKDFKEKTIKYTKINKDCIRFAKNLSIKSQNDTINNINNHSNNFPNSESESNSLELSINSLSGELSCCPNEIRIRYEINNNIIEIFSREFVENNKNKCRIIYNENEYELKNKLNIENDKKNKVLQITLKIVTNITNMEKMFYSYSHEIPLISVDFSNFDSSNVTHMNSMFEGCSLLTSLQGISNFDTSNVINMNSMFYDCSSLVSDSFPEILNWDTSKVISMNHLFFNCSLLKSIPDISKWDTSKVESL